MPTRPKTNRQRGAPSKKNEAIIKRLIAACKLGLPYGIAAQRSGISRETLAQWRSQDADLDRQLAEARAEAAEKAWRKIMAAGDRDTLVIETVTVRIFGLERAAKMEIEFDEGQPKLRDVHSALEELCGPLGWEVLVGLGDTQE
jgi:hypothetical protein